MQDGDVTGLLEAWSGGDQGSFDSLFTHGFHELRILARARFAGERSDHILQPTALVHEVYLRLLGPTRTDWKNRAYFFGACAEIMRRILIDHARQRQAERRGGGATHMTLGSFEENLPGSGEPKVEILALDRVLKRLAELDARQAKIVELRYFGGLTIEQTAEVLNISPTLVKRGWTKARAFLYHQLAAGS